MTMERRTDSKPVPDPEMQQLLLALKDEAVRNYRYRASDWPHEAAVLRYLNSNPATGSDAHSIRMRALDILIGGPF